MKGFIEICLFPFIIYWGIGFYFTDIEFMLLIGVSITFCFGLYLSYYLYYFYRNGTKEKAKVVKKTKASSSGDDMTATFYYQFKVNTKIYEPSYSYNLGPKVGKIVKVLLIKKENRILPIENFYWGFFYSLGFLSTSLFFYYIKIININL
jgi:hypothetical protein